MVSSHEAEFDTGATSPIVNDPDGSWTARCTTCHEVFDLESLGWIRRGAASWGKRSGIHCPNCDSFRMMAIVHVDRFGRPDQPLSFVLKKVLLIQAIVWGILVFVGAGVVGLLWSLGVFG